MITLCNELQIVHQDSRSSLEIQRDQDTSATLRMLQVNWASNILENAFRRLSECCPVAIGCCYATVPKRIAFPKCFQGNLTYNIRKVARQHGIVAVDIRNVAI